MSSAADRMRELRARKRRTAMSVRIVVERELIDQLVESKLLGAWDENDPIAVADAVEALLPGLP
jgi:hypothetical protein